MISLTVSSSQLTRSQTDWRPGLVTDVVTPYPATPTREGVGVDTTRFTFIGPLKLTFYGLFYDGAYKQRDRN